MYYNIRKREDNKKKKGEEIIKRLEVIEEAIFYHSMADRWDIWEEREVETLKAEKRELEKELNNEEEKKEETKEEEKKEETEFIVYDKIAKNYWYFETKEEAEKMMNTYNNWCNEKTDRCSAINF